MEKVVSVLVAEDSPDDVLIIERALKENGLVRPPRVVHDGEQAIRYLVGDMPFGDRRLHPYPDLFLLDLKMPRLSGFEVLEWINRNPDYRVIPTIVLSASADRRDVKHAYCLGAHGFLCKPTSYTETVAIIGKVMTFWDQCEKPGLDPKQPGCGTLIQKDPFCGAHAPYE